MSEKKLHPSLEPTVEVEVDPNRNIFLQIEEARAVASLEKPTVQETTQLIEELKQTVKQRTAQAAEIKQLIEQYDTEMDSLIKEALRIFIQRNK